ncbi:MAG: DinB family protein [Flavobacteriaceae bacterium]|nr:DinB family protein [Flavobacteriaceae bacterium]
MMDHAKIIRELSRNRNVFKELLTGLKQEEYLWKSQPEKWCLLEVICHLHDEEREDFRTRTRLVLENPETPLPPIYPVGWVQERKYIEQDFENMLGNFLKEREMSVVWLKSLTSPKWDNAYQHPKFGPMTAKLYLSNWLAHDYMHIRQINRIRFEYLQQWTGEPLTYAGNW